MTDLLATGRKVADVARDLGVSEQTVYGQRRQERIDRGLEAGVSTLERAEPDRGQGIRVDHQAVERLMHAAGIQGPSAAPVTGSPRPWPPPRTSSAASSCARHRMGCG